MNLTDSANTEPGDGSRLSRQELKEAMLDAGVELLDQRGLSLSFESISYARVFEYLEREYSVRVTRGSVHERIWTSQHEFRLDVLAASVGFTPTGHFSKSLLEHAALGGGPAEFARDIGSRTLLEGIRSDLFGQFQSIKALASRMDDLDATQALSGLLDDWAATALTDCRREFSAILAGLGLRPRQQLGLSTDQVSDLFNLLIGALTDGARLNSHAGIHELIKPMDFMSLAKDDIKPWRGLSVGVQAILDFLFEDALDPAEVFPPPVLPWPQEYPQVHKDEGRSSKRSHSRRPRHKLKDLVLAAGVELLHQQGLQLRPEYLGYSQVFAHLLENRGLTVHRATIHRHIWNSNDDYRTDVLRKSLINVVPPLPAVSKVLRTVPHVLSQDGTIDCPLTARSILHNLTTPVTAVGAELVSYRRLLQIKAALRGIEGPVESENERALAAQVKHVEQERMCGYMAEMQTSLLGLGFRAKPETGLDDDAALQLFVVLGMTTVTGLALNGMAGIAVANRPVLMQSRQEGAKPESWTPAGVAALSYFERLFEPV